MIPALIVRIISVYTSSTSLLFFCTAGYPLLNVSIIIHIYNFYFKENANCLLSFHVFNKIGKIFLEEN